MSLSKSVSRHSLETVAVLVFFAVSGAVFSMARISSWHLEKQMINVDKFLLKMQLIYLYIFILFRNIVTKSNSNTIIIAYEKLPIQ